MIKHIASFAPQIAQRYNPLLLYTALERMHHDYKRITLRSHKKIRPQDVGKRREFQYNVLLFMDIYERKVKEEAEYQETVKASRKERSCLPNTAVGKSCHFTRNR